MNLENTIVQWTVIAREFNTPFLKTGRQKISNAIEDMNNTTNQSDLTGVYRTFHLKTDDIYCQVHTKYALK